MPVHRALWIALILHAAVACEDVSAQSVETQPAQTETGPLFLLPKPPTAEKPQDSASSDSTLTFELERLKQEQEALRTVLTQTPAEASRAVDAHSDSAKRLRSQLDQLTAELANRQNRPHAKAESKSEVRHTTPGSNANKSHSMVSKPTAEPATASNLKKSDANGKPVDSLALAQVLLRMEDYEGAIQAFRAVEFAKLRSDDRAYAQYLFASALRASGRIPEALPLYRDVANCRADAMIADYARWQLSLLQWQQDLEVQIDALRQRRKSLASAGSADPSLNAPAQSGETRPEANKESP